MKNSINQKTICYRIFAVILSIVLLCSAAIASNPAKSSAAGSVSFVVLSKYQKTMKIGQSFFLIGFSSNGKQITWKSSNSRIAAVNTYGEVTAKKAGSCKITGKVRGAEASCKITVQKTIITLAAGTITMENGAFYRLSGTTTSGSPLTWKSSKRSVATIDDNGRIEALKPGTTTITASADGVKRTCKVTVKKPKVTLNKTSVTLFPGKTFRLIAKVSSKRSVTWKSRKTSVAIISEHGLVTAKKKGTAVITAKVDGVTKECKIIVN